MKRCALLLPALLTLSTFAGCSFWEEFPPDTRGADTTSNRREYAGAMVLVRAKDSSFTMGSNLIDGAQPAHTVRFTYDFWMDTVEVTQGRFDAVMSAAYVAYERDAWSATYGTGDRYPVFYRTWYDASLFCNARSRQEGFDTVYRYDSLIGTPGNGCGLRLLEIDMQANGYRLPTEAEWEYACRGGMAGDYYWGSADGREYAWYTANAGGTAHPVALKKPNPFGLYDMAGNVQEWCLDWYSARYPDSALVNPVVLTGVGTLYRIVRGGSWKADLRDLRSASRAVNYPLRPDETVGFRTVRRKY